MPKFNEFEYGTDEKGYQRTIQHRQYTIGYDKDGFQIKVPVRDGEYFDPSTSIEEPDITNPTR